MVQSLAVGRPIYTFIKNKHRGPPKEKNKYYYWYFILLQTFYTQVIHTYVRSELNRIVVLNVTHCTYIPVYYSTKCKMYAILLRLCYNIIVHFFFFVCISFEERGLDHSALNNSIDSRVAGNKKLFPVPWEINVMFQRGNRRIFTRKTEKWIYNVRRATARLWHDISVHSPYIGQYLPSVRFRLERTSVRRGVQIRLRRKIPFGWSSIRRRVPSAFCFENNYNAITHDIGELYLYVVYLDLWKSEVGQFHRRREE